MRRDYPLVEVGVLELNKNPDNYFAEVEQAAFNPANVVTGIGFSPVKMLQGRLFFYGDAQRYRFSVNHHQIPVNAPRCPYRSYHRGGTITVDKVYQYVSENVPQATGQDQHPVKKGEVTGQIILRVTK